MATDERLTFSFNVTNLAAEWHRRYDASRAVVRVPSCLAFRFGCPNDEALPGHPLYARGFDGAAVCEVLESFWIAEMGRRNRVRFPDTDMADWSVRHFLFPFHESTLEMLCGGLEVLPSKKPLAAERGRMQSWLLEEV